MNLPMAIQSFDTKAEIPDQLWTKIEEFQKKGAAQNFATCITTNTSFYGINQDIIKATEATLNEEEQMDT